MDLKLLDLYFKNHKYPFTNHHLDSYRELIKTYIPQTIQSFNPITMIKYADNQEILMKCNVYVGGKTGSEIFIDRPITFENGNAMLITPKDARLRNLTYESHLYANILVEITHGDNEIIEKKFTNVAIGSIPIMLHSDICILNGQGSNVLRKLGECIYDTGGYFIIDGKEKVIISQERNTTNRLLVSKLKNDDYYSHRGIIRCNGESGETMLSARTIEFLIVKTNENSDMVTSTNDDDEEKQPKSTKIAKTILVKLPSISTAIPLVIFFRALGLESDKDIYDSIFGEGYTNIEKSYFDDFIRPSLMDNRNIYTQDGALFYLKQLVKYKTSDHVKNILTSEVFPNIPLHQNKPKYLGYLIKQLFNVAMHISPESDKDSYVYKRVDISGYLLAELFHESYMKLRKFVRDKLDSMYHFGSWNQKKDYENFITKHNIYKLVPNLIISQSFAKSLKGMWGIANEEDPELGKVQDLSRISYIGFLSHLRRVNMPIDRSIKITGPHKLHCQQYGIMCPFETPDGASVGYLKNLAFLTKITSGTSSSNIKRCLVDIGIVPVENYPISYSRDIAKVFVNGSIYGISKDPYLHTRTLKAYRRNSLINNLISISWNIKTNEIRILTEFGRPCRPLIIAHRKITNFENWFDLISGSILELTDKEKSDEFYYRNIYINPETLNVFKNNSAQEILEKLENSAAKIEFLDIEEQDTCYVAMTENDVTQQHTHVEIYPSTMMSVVSANIPFSNHNQSARNVFHAAQSKQAIGLYATNFNDRFDTMSYVHHYPQRPIISTQLSQYTCSDNMPNGYNVVVAIMTYTGFNQEDSIMINKNSVERGLFNISYFKSITATAKDVSQTERIIFGNPKAFVKQGVKVKNIKFANYSLLDEDGFIKEGSDVPKGQKAIIVGMLNVRDIYKEVKKGVFTEMVKETVYTDVSIVTDNSVYGIVNKVFVSDKTVGNNSKVCKVRFLKIRKPEFGDKHASRHGQKGVIGMIIPEESMPFTKDGIRPDIIINPHAIPSRMTIGHLVECVFSKLCCINGVLGDGSVFVPFNDGEVYKELENKGFNSHGNEILYNGFTGQQIETEIFIGPTFYFRLKHMVADKINARGHDRDKSELPKVMLTRQPTSGRRKGGGLRIGEMERDSVLSHGTSLFLKESMMERSDKFSWSVCKRCGIMSVFNPSKKNRIIKCNLCKKDDTVVVQTPYAFKLLTQELQCMGIEMRINTETIDSEIDVFMNEKNLFEFPKIDEEMVGGNFEDTEDENDIDDIDDIEDIEDIEEIGEIEGDDIGEIEGDDIGDIGDIGEVEVYACKDTNNDFDEIVTNSVVDNEDGTKHIHLDRDNDIEVDIVDDHDNTDTTDSDIDNDVYEDLDNDLDNTDIDDNDIEDNYGDSDNDLYNSDTDDKDYGDVGDYQESVENESDRDFANLKVIKLN